MINLPHKRQAIRANPNKKFFILSVESGTEDLVQQTGDNVGWRQVKRQKLGPLRKPNHTYTYTVYFQDFGSCQSLND